MMQESFVFSAENQTGTKEGGGRGGDCTKLSPKIYMEPGQTVTIAEIDGPGEIDHMWFTGVINHGCIIRIYWENSEIPSVESPLPAFFGCAYCENMRDVDGCYPFLNSSMIMVAPARGYNCYWRMPFHSHCKITITNIGVEKQILYYVVAGKRKKQPENIGYFHAAYRQEHPVTKGSCIYSHRSDQRPRKIYWSNFICGLEWYQPLLGGRRSQNVCG